MSKQQRRRVLGQAVDSAIRSMRSVILPRKVVSSRWRPTVLEALESRQMLSALYWDTSAAAGLQAGNGTWSTSDACWNTQADGSGTPTAWVEGSEAHFSASGTSTVTIASSVSPVGMTFDGTGYTVAGGGLVLAGGAGNIVANAGATISSPITGSGNLLKLGAGSLTLTGANTYTGTTTISAGGITIGKYGTSGILGSGAVVNNGTLAFRRTDAITVPNNISGSGSLRFLSVGVLTLTGTNTYSGMTSAPEGTLQIGDGGTSGTLGIGGFSSDGNGKLVFNRSDSVTCGGNLSLAMGLMKLGAGALTLTGNCSASFVTISAGTLQVGNGGTSGSLSGSVTNNGMLVFNRSDSVTVSNVISGSGSLTQQGSGTLTLTKNNTYTGTTTVAAGTLLVSGSLAAGSAAGVGSSATLSGTGTVNGPVTLASVATIKPTGGLGVLRTGSLLVPSGATLAVTLNGDALGAGYGQISVTGTVNLTGSTLSLSGTRPNNDSQSLMILANDGTDPIVGTFAQGATITLNAVDYIISYTGGDGNDVALIDKPMAVTISGAAAGNEGSILCFSSSVTNTPDAITYLWSVTKDGSAFTLPGGTVTNAAGFTFIPTDNGNYGVSVQVQDGHSHTASATQGVTIANVAPTATIVVDPANQYVEGSPLHFTSSVTDPGVNDTFAYAWSVSRDGLPFDLPPGTVTDTAEFTFTPPDSHTYSVMLTVSDGVDGVPVQSSDCAIAPLAPTSFSVASSAGTQATLTWVNQSTTATNVYIYQRAVGETAFSLVAVGGAEQTSYVAQGLLPQTAYGFAISAVSTSGGASATSAATGSVTTPAMGFAVGVTSPAPVNGQTPPVPEGQEVRVGFSAPAGSGIRVWIVSWGDGTQQRFAGSVTGAPHTYGVPASYNIVVTAKDDWRTHSAGQCSVTVADAVPEATVTPLGTTNGIAGSAFTIRLSATDAQPITGWSINWGDGQTGTPDGAAWYATHIYGLGGTYIISATAQDGSGTSVARTLTVNISGATTVASPDSVGASLVGRNTARITWADRSWNEQGFEIAQSDDGGDYAVIGQVGAHETEFTTTERNPLPMNSSVTFRIRAYVGAVYSTPVTTSYVTVSTPSQSGPMAAPSLSLKQAHGQVEVCAIVSSMENIDGAVTHVVYKDVNNKVTGKTVCGFATWMLDDVMPGTTVTGTACLFNTGDDLPAASNSLTTDNHAVFPAPVLSATSTSANTLSLDWAASTSGLPPYPQFVPQFQISEDREHFGPNISAGPSNGGIAGLHAGRYYVRVVFRTYIPSLFVSSPWSNVVTVDVGDGAMPAAPTNLNAKIKDFSSIELAWVDNSNNESGFVVEYSTTGLSDSYQTLSSSGTVRLTDGGGANEPHATVTGLSLATQYWFRVRADNDAVDDPYRNNLANYTYSGPTTITPPTVSISAVGELWEGRLVYPDDLGTPGFLLTRTEQVGIEPWPALTVELQQGGNAVAGEDFVDFGTSVTFAVGQRTMRIPVQMMEDVTPEWTKLLQVRVNAGAGYQIDPLQPDFANQYIADDDYFFIGDVSTPDGMIPGTVARGSLSGDPCGPAVPIDTPFTDPTGDTRYVAGIVDEDWLPWLLDESAAPGNLPEDIGTVLAGGDIDSLAGPPSMGFGGELESVPSTAGAQAMAAGQMPDEWIAYHGQNLAVLEENHPGWTFELSPDGQSYRGTDAKGRVSIFNLYLWQTYYKGTAKGWVIRFGDDGSIQRWGGQFNEDPRLLETIKPSDKMIQELNSVFGPAIEQAQGDQQRLDLKQAYCDPDVLTELRDRTSDNAPLRRQMPSRAVGQVVIGNVFLFGVKGGGGSGHPDPDIKW